MPISRVPGTGLDTGSSGVAPSNLSTGAPSWDGSGNLSFNSGYGSNGVAYGCRAWVNFNGTGTVAIRASGNVTSITDNAVGEYTVNITTALPDANYSVVGTCTDGGNGYIVGLRTASAYSTTAVAVGITNAGVARADVSYVTLAIFR